MHERNPKTNFLKLNIAAAKFRKAVENDNHQLADQLLCEYKNDQITLLNSGDWHGDTPLMLAIRKGNISLAGILINNHLIDLAATNKKGRSAFTLSLDGVDVPDFLFVAMMNQGYQQITAEQAAELLFDACVKNQIEKVKILLKLPNVDVNTLQAHHFKKSDKDINYRFRNDDSSKSVALTPLQAAIVCGHTEIARLLLADSRINLNANCETLNGLTLAPIQTAIACERGAIMKELLSVPEIHQRFLNVKNSHTLKWLADHTDAKTFKTILQLPSTQFKGSIDSLGLLEWDSIKFSRSEIIGVLINQPGFDVNAPLWRGLPALHEAVRLHDVNSVKTLLQNPGVDVNAAFKSDDESLGLTIMQRVMSDKDWRNRDSKLKMMQALFGHPKLDQKYLPGQSAPELQWIHQHTSLNSWCAVLNVIADRLDDVRSVEKDGLDWSDVLPMSDNLRKSYLSKIISALVVQPDFDINAHLWNGETAITWAAKNNNDVLAKLLAMPQCDLSKQNANGETPLIAAGNSNARAAILQHQNFGHLYVQDNTENTPITQAKDQLDISLLLHGRTDFDFNQRYKYGKTLLMLAVEKRNAALVEYLLKNNLTDVNAVDENGNTALIIAAASYKNAGIVKMLLDHGADACLANKKGMSADEVANACWPKSYRICVYLRDAVNVQVNNVVEYLSDAANSQPEKQAVKSQQFTMWNAASQVPKEKQEADEVMTTSIR